MKRIEIGHPKGDAELRAFFAVFEESLVGAALPAGFFERFTARTPRSLVWIARRKGTVAGGYVLLPFGQFFGGRSVPMSGVSAVAVAPEHRGEGVALALMRHALAESRRLKRPLSALYPATQTLYRAAGFELAGSRTLYRVPTRAIDSRARPLDVRRATAADAPRLRALHRRAAIQTNGNLDRGDWSWKRILEDPSVPVHAYLVGRGRSDEGYVVLHHKPEPTIRYDVHVRDFAALTPAAGRRIWTLLSDHRSMALSVHLYGAPAEPLLHLLPEQDFQVETRWDWMLRIVDVAGAMTARGWPAGYAGRLELAVADDVVRANAGKWTVEIAGGRAKVARGGPGRIRIDVRGLAALYTSRHSPSELARIGALEGPEEDLALAATAFAGPPPWMPDMF